jgi:hypothetical protein
MGGLTKPRQAAGIPVSQSNDPSGVRYKHLIPTHQDRGAEHIIWEL